MSPIVSLKLFGPDLSHHSSDGVPTQTGLRLLQVFSSLGGFRALRRPPGAGIPNGSLDSTRVLLA